MAFITAAIIGGSVAAAGGLAKLGMSLSGRKARKQEQKNAKKAMQDRMTEYENLDTSNLNANVKNQFAGIQTNFENVYEDLTVNQQQAQFQAQQGAQQRANIMSSLSGAAGGSGIAGLAQAMANQGQLATQQASASIGQQESMNQRLLAQGAGREQDLERQAQLQVAQGEAYADAQRRAGAETSRGLEYSKTGTLLGMSQQRVGAANQARAQAKAQQMGAIGDIASAGLSIATAGMKMGTPGGGGGGGATGVDLSQATVSGSGLDLSNPLYQSAVGGNYGTGAVSIGGVGQTKFKDLSGLTI